MACDADVAEAATVTSSMSKDPSSSVTTSEYTSVRQVAVKPPSDVVAVMSHVPLETPVTTPDDETVAMDGSEEVQVTLLFVALAGEMEADNENDSPSLSERLLVFKLIPVTETLWAFTVAVQ